MTRRARLGVAAAEAPVAKPALIERLLDIRDQLAEARCVTAAAWLACASPALPRDTSAALSAVTNIAREQLDDVLTALDAVIASLDARGHRTR